LTLGDEAALAMLKGIEKSFGGVPVVDLDDLCRAEVFLAEAEAASGRYICSSFDTTVVEIAQFLADKYPQYSVNIGSGELLEKPRVRLSSAKLVKQGFEFRCKTLDEVYQGVVEYGKALGILPY
jgi:anthocyanidin reductase